MVETIFRGIEWNTSRNGVVVPTGLFDEITILDSNVSRATLHNLDYIDKLKLRVGNRICCSKRNMVIPAIEVNLDYDSYDYKLPIIDKCPSCGERLVIKNTGTANVLYCQNEDCSSRKLAQFVHFVSKKCMSIDGLSESIISFLINKGWIKSFQDIYHLQDYKTKWDLGDIVNIKKEKWGIYTTYRIIEVEETIEDGKKTIYPTFGSPLSSAWDDE